MWNIPFSRNPFFTGREDLLERLHTHLHTTRTITVSQPLAISGLGGIGKTQLVVEYAYRYGQAYQAVLWARAETSEALNASFTEIASVLHLPQKEAQEQEVIVQAVKGWLRDTSGWLLLLDNADDLNLVQSFLPPRFAGHLLLTTRAQIMGKFARRLEVDTLTPEAGALLLLRRAGLVEANAVFKTASPSDQSLALALTEELGGLPLALDQAGAYIEETQCSLADYQQHYQTRRAELLAHRSMLVDDHPEPVLTTWSLSCAKVEEANPTAADVLRICAFLAPDAIPEEVLLEALKTPRPTSEETDLEEEEGGGFSRLPSGQQKKLDSARPPAKGGQMDKAVALLRAYSLIQRHAQAKTLSIHRLVQVVLREGLDEHSQRLWAEQAMRAIVAALPAVVHEKWFQWERIVLHAQVCVQQVKDNARQSRELTKLLQQTGWYLAERARYREAEPLLERAYRISQRERGTDHLDTARDALTLAYLYESQGKYAQAEPLYVRALAIREQQLGAEHP
ncbi:MAG: tetratricopeptide repeat protein, partial [Ktedonobacteraceae bacterium]